MEQNLNLTEKEEEWKKYVKYGVMVVGLVLLTGGVFYYFQGNDIDDDDEEDEGGKRRRSLRIGPNEGEKESDTESETDPTYNDRLQRYLRKKKKIDKWPNWRYRNGILNVKVI